MSCPSVRGTLTLCAALAASLLSAPPATSLPLLSEVLYDATGADDGRSFVEIFATPGLVLDGYNLVGVNGANGAEGPTLALSGTVPVDGFFVVADRFADGTTAVAEADLLRNFDFQNGPDSVLLRLGAVVIDALGYGVFGPAEVFAGEGASAPDAPAGSSLARRFADVDTDDNALDFVTLAAPTPGFGPRVGVPEPASAWLLAVGLASLGAGRRRRL